MDTVCVTPTHGGMGRGSSNWIGLKLKRHIPNMQPYRLIIHDIFNSCQKRQNGFELSTDNSTLRCLAVELSIDNSTLGHPAVELSIDNSTPRNPAVELSIDNSTFYFPAVELSIGNSTPNAQIQCDARLCVKLLKQHMDSCVISM